MFLFEKYDVPVPPYTGYPAVPHWQDDKPRSARWLTSINNRLAVNRDINLYIHLPSCHQFCTRCACNKRVKDKHANEGRYVDALLAELTLYLQSLHPRPRLRELRLGGGTPAFFTVAQLGRLIDGITTQLEVAPGHDFSFGARPYGTTREQLALLADHGFNRIRIGVQDLSERSVRRKRRPAGGDVVRTVTEAQALGFGVNFDLTYGLPTQTLSDVIHTAAKVRQLMPDRIAFNCYAQAPRFRSGQGARSEADPPKGRERYLLHRVGRRLLEVAGYRAVGLDHFALPDDELYRASCSGRLHRNFLGYTTADNPVTIGLGCSAIGDSRDHYVQNEQKVEDYQRIVLQENSLPLVRGHVLTPDEKKVRRHILNLMCRGKTEWREEELRCPAIERATEHWLDMAVDGIVKRSPYRVEATAAGRPYLRSICLPLDDHYWSGETLRSDVKPGGAGASSMRTGRGPVARAAGTDDEHHAAD